MPSFNAGGISLHCEIAGDGPALLLLHGIGSNSQSWRRQLACFSAHFRTIAWDAPGFGLSADPPVDVHPSMKFYAESLGALFETLGITDAAILGHSLGGIIAQEFCRTSRERVRALILADTTRGGLSEPEELRARKLAKRIDMIRSLTPAELARERAPGLLSASAPRDVVEEAIRIMSQVRRPGYEFASIAMSEAGATGVVESLSVPTLLIWGDSDGVTPAWPDVPARAVVRIIPQAGHLSYAEQPDAFNSAVLSFLNAN